MCFIRFLGIFGADESCSCNPTAYNPLHPPFTTLCNTANPPKLADSRCQCREWGLYSTAPLALTRARFWFRGVKVRKHGFVVFGQARVCAQHI